MTLTGPVYPFWVGLVRDLAADTMTWDDGRLFNSAIFPPAYIHNRRTHFYMHSRGYLHDAPPAYKKKVLCQANLDQVPVY